MARDLAGDAFGVLRPALNALTLRRRPIVAHQFFERCEKSSNGDVSRCRVVWRTSFHHLAFEHPPCARWKPPRRRATAESAPRATCRDGPNRAGRREIAEASWSCPGALVPARQGVGFSHLRTSGREPGKVLITRVPADLALPALGARRRMDHANGAAGGTKAGISRRGRTSPASGGPRCSGHAARSSDRR